MKKALKIIACTILLFPIGILVYINIRLHTNPDLENQEETKQDVVRQLNFLCEGLKNNNLGAETQNLYPEGFVFINTLYGLTWAEVAKSEKSESELFKRGLFESRYAYKEINSEYAKSIFDEELKPSFGIFYRGWKNYLLGKILAVQTKKDTSEIKEFKASCDSIASAISQSSTPFLESYWNASWPADAFVAVASLKLHDEIFEPKYDTIIKNWILKVKSNLDTQTGLLSHASNSKTGKTEVGARGSSICLMLIFLADIDPEFAQQQFKVFTEKFPITRFGFLAVREYPEGKDGKGDNDSGPIVWDIGFAGTVVSTGTFKKFGEYDAANQISGCVEGFGFPLSNGNQKKYLFGKLPITDAFTAWARMQEPNKVVIQNKGINTFDWGSTFLFHLVSLLVICILTYLLWRRKIR